MEMLAPLLPEIRLHVPVQVPPGVVPMAPPMVLMGAESMQTPALPLGIAAVPSMLVPIKLPWTLLPVAVSLDICTPQSLLPEIQLRSATVLPPTILLTPSSMFTPFD